MASLVVKAMERIGVKILSGCVPKSIKKDAKSGHLIVTWLTPSREEIHDQFDTVLMAAGQLC